MTNKFKKRARALAAKADMSYAAAANTLRNNEAPKETETIVEEEDFESTVSFNLVIDENNWLQPSGVGLCKTRGYKAIPSILAMIENYSIVLPPDPSSTEEGLLEVSEVVSDEARLEAVLFADDKEYKDACAVLKLDRSVGRRTKDVTSLSQEIAALSNQPDPDAFRLQVVQTLTSFEHREKVNRLQAVAELQKNALVEDQAGQKIEGGFSWPKQGQSGKCLSGWSPLSRDPSSLVANKPAFWANPLDYNHFVGMSLLKSDFGLFKSTPTFMASYIVQKRKALRPDEVLVAFDFGKEGVTSLILAKSGSVSDAFIARSCEEPKWFQELTEESNARAPKGYLRQYVLQLDK